AADAGTPLVRWIAPGGGGEGGRQNRARESDSRDDYFPELFSHVQETCRHDRYGGNGSGGVFKDLQPGCGCGSYQSSIGAEGKPRRRLSYGEGKIPGSRQWHFAGGRFVREWHS